MVGAGTCGREEVILCAKKSYHIEQLSRFYNISHDWEPEVLMRRCPVQQSFGSLPEDSEMQYGRWLKSVSFS